MVKLSGLNIIWTVFLWLFVGLTGSKKKLKIWYLIASFSIVLFAFISPMPDRYLYGIMTIVYFIIALSLTRKRWGWLILSIVIILLIRNVIKNPAQLVERSIPILENNINVLIERGQINNRQKIAVLTAFKAYMNITPQGGSTPQSNDYRFFLRTKGYQALDVPKYSQADVLIMFIEDPDFDWQEWRSWELDQFGEKKLRLLTTLGQTRIIVFDKKQ